MLKEAKFKTKKVLYLSRKGRTQRKKKNQQRFPHTHKNPHNPTQSRNFTIIFLTKKICCCFNNKEKLKLKKKEVLIINKDGGANCGRRKVGRKFRYVIFFV